MSKFVGKYTRAWYETYKAHMKQHRFNAYIIPESTFKYWEPVILQELWKPYKKRSYTNKKEARKSKQFFDKLYKQYNFIINVDGKSLEDIPTVQKNMRLRMSCKWVSQAIEIQSWLVFDLAVEKSHNKTNAKMLMREMVTTIRDIFGSQCRILFISDAWSEYLNNKKLHMVSELDTSKLCEFLRKEWC